MAAIPLTDLQAEPFCWDCDTPMTLWVRCPAGCEDGYEYDDSNPTDTGRECPKCFGRGGVFVCPACQLVASRSEG